MRASATSRISSHAVTPQASSNSNKADDTSPFALMLAATASASSKTKNDTSKQDDKDQPPAQDTAQAADSGQPAAAQALAQTPAKGAKDSKDTNKSSDADDASAPAADTTAADPSSLMAMMAPQQPPAPPVTTAPVNDNDGDELDATAATASAAKNAGADATATPQAQSEQADAQQQAQQAAPDLQAAAAPQGKPGAKPGKTADASDTTKPAARKTATADAGDGVKDSAAQPAVDAARAEPAPAARDTQPQSQAHAPDITLTGVTSAQPGTPQAGTAQAAQATTTAHHVDVSAQPQPNVPALAVQIAARSQSGSRQFDIRLDPPELGHVEVRLSIDNTGKASAHLSADQPQTLDLLQKDAPALTRALRDAGLDVSQDGLNFSLRQQADGRESGFTGNGRSRGNLTAGITTDATTTTNATSAYRAPLNGRLDIRV